MKLPLILNNLILNYKDNVIYLGMFISDTGSLLSDVKSQINLKHSDVSVKLNNFIAKNMLCPFSVKRKIFNSCFNSSILYACESWCDCNLNYINTTHIYGLKRILGVKKSTPNAMVVIESGFTPIEALIKSRQLKYWLKFKNFCLNNPSSSITYLYNLAESHSINFLNYYVNLENSFTEPNICKINITNSIISDLKLSIRNENDVYMPLGTYFKINPSLSSPSFYFNDDLHEHERILISRYRLGNHYLLIETGRWSNLPRQDRICDKCFINEIQSLEHIIFRCGFTRHLFINYNFTNLTEFFNSSNCYLYLKFFEKHFTL